MVLISTPLHIALRSKIKSFLLERAWPTTHQVVSHIDGIGVEHRILDRIRPVVDADVPDADVVVATYYRTAEGVQRLSPAKGAKALFLQGYETENIKPSLESDTWHMPMHKIVVSRWLVDLAREEFGDNIVSYVPNGVDLNQFHAASRWKMPVPTVGVLHHNSPVKGVGISIKVLQLVAREIPSLRVVSFGAEHPSLRLRLPRFAEFHYRPPQERLRELYAQCDVWLSASILEGFCLPLLEAMACRCPVVSTRAGGPIDLIEEGLNGYLVDVNDVHALADRVLRVLRLQPEEWRKMSDAAYNTARSFTWDDATDRFEQALELAIERDMRGEFKSALSCSTASL